MPRRQTFVVSAIALICIGATGALAADAPAGVPFFERLDPRTGLSHNSVHAIVQDRLGFLWFGTPDGLNRYDGHDVVIFRHQPDDEATLSSNVVLSLLEDRAGSLWVGTAAGVDRFEPSEGRFVRYILPRATVDADPRGRLLYETRDGRLLVASDEVFRYDPVRDRFEPWVENDRNASAPRREVGGLAEDSRGSLWMFERHYPGPTTLGRIDLDTRTVERWPVEPAALSAATLMIDSDDRFWIHPTGPLTFDQTSGCFTQANASDGALAWASTQQPNGDIWIGSAGDGLTRFRPGDPVGRPYTLGENPGYLENFVRTLYEDRAGTLWVGTHGGVYRSDPHRKPFLRIRHDASNPASLSHDAVSAVVEVPGGDLWIGTYGGGLNRYDRRTGHVSRIRGAGAPAVILSMAVGLDGTIWIGSASGLANYDPLRATLTAHVLRRVANASQDVEVNAIAVDRTGALWLAAGNGLYRYDPERRVATAFPVATDSSGPSAPYLQGLLLDRSNGVWMGSNGVALDRLDVEAGRFERYPLVDGHGRSLDSEGIWQIMDAEDGDLWLATGSGLLRFDRRRGTFERYSDRDGLPGTIVYAMARDDDGYLWLGTNRGLSRFDPDADPAARFWNFERGDGLDVTEFNRRAVLSAGDELFFGTLDGLVRFEPGRLRRNPTTPPVVLTRLQRAGRDGVWSGDPTGLDTWDLPSGHAWFSFEFAALNFTNPAKNRHRYRLEGFDRDWSRPQVGRSARYTNVPPGRYRFRVMGSNNDDIWNEDGVSLAVTIAAPYWQTWWFRSLAVVALGVILFGLHRYRLAQATTLQDLRLGIASDLHDDLSTDLSGVAIWAEMMARRPHVSDHDRTEFDQVRRTVVGMLDGLRDCVWYVNPEHDSLAATVRRMQDVATRLTRGVACRFTAPPSDRSDMPISMPVRRNVFLIFKEALHNAVRHAKADTIEVDVTVDKSRLQVRVVDDGVGFEVGRAHDGNGLSSLRRRAAQIGADLAIESSPRMGTAVTLRVALS